MNMEHKAFLFDTKKYHRDIEPVLRECIRTQSSDAAEAYITAHLPELTSPYTGEPLDEDWHDEREDGGLQEYADFLLTACYDSSADEGLSYAWEGVIDIIRVLGVSDAPDSFVLGQALVCEGVTIDPGAMGLGVVEAEQMTERLTLLTNHPERLDGISEDDLSEDSLYECDWDELTDAYDDLCGLYAEAQKQGMGLLFTF